jgi:hypothetical protein
MPGKEPGVEKRAGRNLPAIQRRIARRQAGDQTQLWDFTIPFPRDRLTTAARMNNCIFPHCP